MSKTVEPRYLGHFRCRGAECEDSCCSGKDWHISHDDHRRLKVVLGESSVAQATVRQGSFPEGSIRLRRDRSGHCYFLRQDRLCQIHASHGAPALPSPCAEYPRTTQLVGDHLERVGTLACPEIARLCLLGDVYTGESWLTLHEVDVEGGPRLAEASGDQGAPPGPYADHFELVRDALLGILSREDRSIEARLEALVNVAERVSSYFNEHSEAFDTFALRARLEQDFKEAFAPRARRAAGLDDLMAVRVGAYFLDEHAVDRSSRLGRLVEKIRRKYERKLERHHFEALDDGEALAACGVRSPRLAEKLGRRDPESLLRTYRARRALMRLGHGRRLERYFTNYCLNYVLVERYVDYPSLRDYARDLALCLAALRFLLFSNPGICIPWEGEAEGPESREVEGEGWSSLAVDGAAVETFQSFTRAIERSSLLADLRRATRIDDTPGATGLLGLVSS